MALYGVIFLVVLNLQQVQGLTPLESGLGLLAPFVLITFFAGPAGKLADRIGPRLQMVAGPLVVAAGMAWLATARTQANYFTSFMPGMIIFGGGMAIVIAPLTKCALSVSPEYSGAASGFNNAVSRVAALMGVAALGAIVISIFNTELTTAIIGSSLSGAEKEVILAQTERLLGIRIPDTFSAVARETTADMIKTAFVSGFRWAMGISAALAVVSAVISFFTIHNAPKPHKTTVT
jgi:MFS family permease